MGLMIKGELGLSLSVADSELEALFSGLRSKGVLKCGGIIKEIGLIEAKGKEGLRVEWEERKSLREGILLKRTTGIMVFLIIDFKEVLLTFMKVLSRTVEDISRLGSKRAGAEEGTKIVSKARAIIIVDIIREKGVRFSRTKNKEKETMGEEDESSTKGVLSHKLVSSKVIRLLALVLRSI